MQYWLMQTYRERLHQHLAEYKRTQLSIVEDGVWVRNKQPYAHILPASHRDANILEPVRSAFWDYASRKDLLRHLHRDFLHLSSSQALAFNVFFPFVGTPWGKPSGLLYGLGLPNKKIASWDFELAPDAAEGTTFDFYATFIDGTRLFVEVKLSEPEFGRCPNDDTHHKKLTNTDQKRLIGKVVASALEPLEFFSQYQLLRNVSHLKAGDVLILLVPRANARTFSQARRFVQETLTDVSRGAVRVVALEDLFARIKNRSSMTATSDIAPTC
jgi:hypothetical protein